MTVTLEPHPTWPDGEAGKVLLNCTISTSVDEVFEELFGSYPQTQVWSYTLSWLWGSAAGVNAVTSLQTVLA
jgi:hypothetical protein